MNKSEQATYLRNVVLLALADNFLDTAEEAYLEGVRTSIGATKTLLKNTKKAPGDGINLLSLSRVSDRIRCIEDMIGCAVSDGELPPEEAQLIMGAAKDIGLPAPLLETILEEVQSRQSASVLPCPSCGTEFTTQAKFCSECGTSFGEKKRTDVTVPDAGITVCFAKSSSATFIEALALAKAESSFQETTSSPQWYGVTFPKSRSDAAGKLASRLRKLRNRRVYIDGREQDWKGVFKFAKCAETRSKAYRPNAHCLGDGDIALNLWGCRQVGMKWFSRSSLFKHGTFTSNTVFELDKQRIAHELNQRVGAVELCPYFNRDMVAAAFHALPDRVTVDSSGNGSWDYFYVHDPAPNSIRVTGLYGDPMFAAGVRPTDPNLIKHLIAVAAAKCGATVDLTASPAA